MRRLHDLRIGEGLSGLLPDRIVRIIALQYPSDDAVRVKYREADGRCDTILLTRQDEARLSLAEADLPPAYTADADAVRFVLEACRLRLAYLFDPYLAVHTSFLDPLPHQIAAVYQEMLPRIPLRYILADDPGAGKTIMTGLYIKEMMARGAVERCLIVAPGSLIEQWQDELQSRFHLSFKLLRNELTSLKKKDNVFLSAPLCLGRLDKLARDEELQSMLGETFWDLIVVDEAHKMSSSVSGGKIRSTRRFRLGQLLSSRTRNFLLLTATPHNGKSEDFQQFLSLIDPDRFGGVAPLSKTRPDLTGVMRRMIKEELLRFDGTPLFPERFAHSQSYQLSPPEMELYEAVTAYVRQEFSRADRLDDQRRRTVGFALTILQRRLASSPEAIAQSLTRRRKRLTERLQSARLYRADEFVDLTDLDDADRPADELEELEEDLVDEASAAASKEELIEEIDALRRLEAMADAVRLSGVDRKWDELSGLLQDDRLMYETAGKREKLIIFTEHRDTLSYLAKKITSLLGSEKAVVTIHGGLSRTDRRQAEKAFREDDDVHILVATDAAGEGINLQRAHLMINYDLPWNPNRLEQRFGRIHRIGQQEVCHLWNLIAAGTREGLVFRRLFSKIEEERKALGGKVFDVLGKLSFEDRPLRDLLIDAVRSTQKTAGDERLIKIVDQALDPQRLKDLVAEKALVHDVMDQGSVRVLAQDLDRADARRLQPYFIRSFFLGAFRSLGGDIRERADDRYEIKHVPADLLPAGPWPGRDDPSLLKQRVTFKKEATLLSGQAKAVLICPGHPLFDRVVETLIERDEDLLQAGTIYIDENDHEEKARLLCCVEESIIDAAGETPKEEHVIDRRIHFIEVTEEGSACDGGAAPYLDYRSPTTDERDVLLVWLKMRAGLDDDLENKALLFAQQAISEPFFERFKTERLIALADLEQKIKSRLSAEIRYWDRKATELHRKEKGGIESHQTAANATRRADELVERLKRRQARIDAERKVALLPPRLLGRALIVPVGLLQRLMEKTVPPFTGGDHRLIEAAAMKAVMDIERMLGHVPRDVSRDKCGYDIESSSSSSSGTGFRRLRKIEVKGRQKEATTVTVSRNEINTALNQPEEFILAIVEVDGELTRTIYLKHPFERDPDPTVTSVNYDLRKLIDSAEVIYRE